MVGAVDGLVQLCQAALLVLPSRAVFSDETAAALMGLPAPQSAALHVCVPEKDVAVRRRGIVGHVRHLTELEVGRRFDLPVTTPERTFVDLAARLPAGELLGFVDAALRARLATPSGLAEVLARHAGCRGVAKARRLLDHANPAAESPRESMVRWLLIEAGLPVPEVNVNIYDLDGVFLARADLFFRKARVIVEYDGDQHRTDRAQFVKDIQRTTRLAAAGYLVLRFTGADLITRRIADAQTLAECLAAGRLDAELARETGALVARFHRAGIWHADLNAHNVLVTPVALHLIDFDRGRVRELAADWRLANLARLHRSLVKLGAVAQGEEAFRASVWTPLIETYEATFGA